MKRRKRRSPIKGILAVGLSCGVAILGYEAFAPAKNITAQQFPAAVDPGNLREIEEPDVSGYLLIEAPDLSQGDLTLVNNKIAYPFTADEGLSSVYEGKTEHYKVKNKEVLVAGRILGPLNAMLEDFYEATGRDTINIISGHRTYAYQEMLYDRDLAQKSPEEAGKYVALPGGSEHHTGLAVDFEIRTSLGSQDFMGQDEYGWLNENAYRYGFVVRYQHEKRELTGIYDEPWHFRYVGLPHAYAMEAKDFCLEEYIDYLRQFQFGQTHLKIEADGLEYEIYYLPGDTVYVPAEGAYTISGNNVDGYIVTMEK